LKEKDVRRPENITGKNCSGGVTVASDQQIAANRRNARRSTGPRSGGGKKRVGRNAYRHGLSLRISSISTFTTEVERLARKIAGDTEHEIIHERARDVAEAQLDLARVQRAMIALIEHARAFGALDCPLSETIDRFAMPTQEPQQSAEAMRRVLPELVRLDRYERRAASRRDQALRRLVEN
jgi:hypothetical protein